MQQKHVLHSISAASKISEAFEDHLSALYYCNRLFEIHADSNYYKYVVILHSIKGITNYFIYFHSWYFVYSYC